MNSLSWLIYFADIVPNFAGFCIFLAIAFGILTALYVMVKAFANSGDDDAEAFVKIPLVYFSPAIFFVAAFVSILLPSREAIYLIAGSEAGEMVVTSEAGKEILGDIQAVIKGQLEALKPKGP